MAGHGLAWLLCSGLLLTSSAAAVYQPVMTLLRGGFFNLDEFLVSDATFTLGACLFLWWGRQYGWQQHPAAAPYSGAWLSLQGRQVLPDGFSLYLPLAALLSLLLPTAALVLLALTGRAQAGGMLLGGYLATFVVQMLLETRFFHRNPMSPAIPFVFAPYRFWQLARSLCLLRAARQVVVSGIFSVSSDGNRAGAALALTLAAAPTWVRALLLFLLAFWVFDYGVTAVQLPWVFNWQLQAAGRKASSADGAAAAAAAVDPTIQPAVSIKQE